MKQSFSIYIFQAVSRNTILTLVNLLVVIIVLVVARTDLKPIVWVCLPVLLLYVLSAVWVTILFASLGSRYRDFTHLIQTVMRVMMFLTPIFWTPEQMGELMKVLNWNPMAHYIYILRDPILYGTFPMKSFYIVLSITVAGFILAFFTFAYSRRRIVFWI